MRASGGVGSSLSRLGPLPPMLCGLPPSKAWSLRRGEAGNLTSIKPLSFPPALLGVGPVMGFPGCPSQKDKQEQKPNGVEFDGVGFLRWHGNRSATRKAVEDVARENNKELKPLIRAGKVKK